jgi:hypothetical protein
MTLCTPHERSALSGVRMTAAAAEPPADSPRRLMFKPPDWEWTGFGEIGWWCRDGWDEVLLGPSGLRLEEWRAEGRVTTVKSGPHRVVYRVELPLGAIYLKHFLVPDWRSTIRQWVRRGKGRNEGKRCRESGSSCSRIIW